MESVTSLFAIVNTLRYGAEMEDKLNRQHWLGAGLEVLAAQGLQGLRIMPIAQQLGVTKGSFYWHFGNLDEYQLALLEEWEQRHTQQIIQYVDSQGGDAFTKLRNLMTVTVNADARLAKAIRSWADTSPQAQAAQSRVDHDRLVYLHSLLTQLGWADDKAQTFARWMYCALIGHFSLQGPPILAEQIGFVLETLTPEPAAKRKAQ
jgi:AcrR family transcriptional regulator